MTGSCQDFVNKFLQKFTGGDSVFVKDKIYVNQTPQQKSQVVSAIKKANHNSFNIFIGDGFNDRLAFKESDLGILFDHDTESQKLLIGNYDFSIKSFKNLESIFSLAKDVYVLDWLITCWTVCYHIVVAALLFFSSGLNVSVLASTFMFVNSLLLSGSIYFYHLLNEWSKGYDLSLESLFSAPYHSSVFIGSSICGHIERAYNHVSSFIPDCGLCIK